MEGVKSLTVDMDPMGFVEQDALDCFFEIPYYTIVAEKVLKNLYKRVFARRVKKKKIICKGSESIKAFFGRRSVFIPPDFKIN